MAESIKEKHIMEMKKDNSLTSGAGSEGEWKTMNGAHVLIKDGETPAEAFGKSNTKQTKKAESKTQATPKQAEPQKGTGLIHMGNIDTYRYSYKLPIKTKAEGLKTLINDSWYESAKRNYGIDGKVKDISVEGESIVVTIEEDGRTFSGKFYVGDYSIDNLYNIWMDDPESSN